MLPSTEQQNLVAHAQTIFSNVCTQQLGTMKHAPCIETDFTGSFVKNGVPALNMALQKVLEGYGIDVTTRAVYIHQSPIVSIKVTPPRKIRTSQCELGDILLVQSHKRNPWKTYWRAALWQLKMDNGQQQIPGDPQYWLYNQWPLFEVVRGGLVNGLRNFDKDNRSGYYGLVSKAGWQICPPASPIGPRTAGIVDAGRFVIEMMYAVDPAQPNRNPDRGRRVFTRPKSSPHQTWSGTIWELLNITGAKNFRSTGLYHGAHSRLSLMYSSDPAESNVGPPPMKGVASDVDERGMFLIHISVDASEFDQTGESQL